MKKTLSLFLLIALTFPSVVCAEEKMTSPLAEVDEPPRRGFDPFSLELKRNPTKRRSTIWPVLTSFLLPGFDQWWEGQYQGGLLYSGVALGGLQLYVSAKPQDIRTSQTSLSSRDDRVRQATYGLQLYQTSGFLSGYHAFRAAVPTRKAQGEFLFLTKEERTSDLMLAPFEFSHVLKPTTFIPLGLLTGASILYISSGDSPRARAFKGTDALYSSLFSYGAGVGEEAFFRGWMLPQLNNAFGSEFWSNALTGTIFGGIHASSENPFPWPQIVMGWYLGWMTQKNEWTLSEAIFVHTWWDVIAFTAAYLDEPSNPKARIYIPVVSTTY